MTLLQEALAPRSDQLNGDDLISGPRTIKITAARIIEGDRGAKRVSVRFEGDNGKPWNACKTMGRAMVMVWGIVDSGDQDKISAQFAGKSLTLYRDPDVDFGKEKGIGGIRISHMSHIDGAKTVKLTVSQGKKKAFVFQPLTAEVTQHPAKKRQTAAEWASDHIAAIQNADTLDALSDLIGTGAKPMVKLESENAELWAEVNAAYAARRADLEAEGKPVSETGEGFTDASDAGGWEE